MFDIGNFKVSEAVEASENYKMVKSGNGWIYVFPADIDFTPLDTADFSPGLLERQAILVISSAGRVTRSRYGYVPPA